MADETIQVRALRPFRTPAGIWIMPGPVVELKADVAQAGFASGACVPARTGVDEAAVIKLRETAMVRAAAQGNGKCHTSSTQARPRSLSRSKT